MTSDEIKAALAARTKGIEGKVVVVTGGHAHLGKQYVEPVDLGAGEIGIVTGSIFSRPADGVTERRFQVTLSRPVPHPYGVVRTVTASVVAFAADGTEIPAEATLAPERMQVRYGDYEGFATWDAGMDAIDLEDVDWVIRMRDHVQASDTPEVVAYACSPKRVGNRGDAIAIGRYARAVASRLSVEAAGRPFEDIAEAVLGTVDLSGKGGPLLPMPVSAASDAVEAALVPAPAAAP